MIGKAGKNWSGILFVEKITGAFEGLITHVSRFNDNLESLRSEIKRFNDLRERRTELKPSVKAKEQLRKAAGKPQPERRTPGPPSPMTIPDTLYKSILAISKKNPEFTVREVIDRAMKTSRGSFKKQSMLTAFQGFKVSSKTAHKQPEKCRNLLVAVEGKKGLYKLNPEKPAT